MKNIFKAIEEQDKLVREYYEQINKLLYELVSVVEGTNKAQKKLLKKVAQQKKSLDEFISDFEEYENERGGKK